jgi:hypothetical protein
MRIRKDGWESSSESSWQQVFKKITLFGNKLWYDVAIKQTFEVFETSKV